jgi:hypothetical protein
MMTYADEVFGENLTCLFGVAEKQPLERSGQRRACLHATRYRHYNTCPITVDC